MENRIKEIIKKELKAEVLDIVKINEGFSHNIFLVKINKEPKEIILRFSNNSHKKWATLGKEEFVISLLRRNNIPAPKILAFDNDPEKGYMIQEKLSGKRLDTIWEKISREEKIQITEKIGKLLADFHKIEFDKFGLIEDGGNIDFDKPFTFKKAGEVKPFSESIRQKYLDFMREFSIAISFYHLNKEFIIDFFAYIMRNIKEIEYSGKPVFTHCDLMLGHIFVEKINKEYKIIGIIDFEFAESTCPEYDFIKLHRKGFFEDKELLSALERGYGKEINKKAVEYHRLMRDFAFASVLLNSGDNKTAEEVFDSIKHRIKKD